jgi:phage baseplate assembly protein W
MATINRVVRRFTDLNLSFQPHPYSKDIMIRNNVDAIKTSIINLIRTKNYERPFHPEIGCQATALLFENSTPATINAVKRTIQDTVTKFEPRASILDIAIDDNTDNNALDISIVFSIDNVSEPITVLTTITRVR